MHTAAILHVMYYIDNQNIERKQTPAHAQKPLYPPLSIVNRVWKLSINTMDLIIYVKSSSMQVCVFANKSANNVHADYCPISRVTIIVIG